MGAPGSQGDLDVVIDEAIEGGAHAIAVEVSGMASRRTLDLWAGLLGIAATVSQVQYLIWLVYTAHGTLFNEIVMWVVVLGTLVANFGTFSYLFDDETSDNRPFMIWVRRSARRAPPPWPSRRRRRRRRRRRCCRHRHYHLPISARAAARAAARPHRRPPTPPAPLPARARRAAPRVRASPTARAARPRR